MLSNFLSSVDSGTMILGTFFLIVFAVLMFLLNKTLFKENRGITTIIAFCIALLSTWGINKSGFNLSGTFTSIGLSENALYTITPILLIVVVVLASITKDKITQRKSFSLSRFFLVLGSFMIILGVSPLIYQKGFYIVTGAVLWVLAIIMLLKKKRNMNFGKIFFKIILFSGIGIIIYGILKNLDIALYIGIGLIIFWILYRILKRKRTKSQSRIFPKVKGRNNSQRNPKVSGRKAMLEERYARNKAEKKLKNIQQKESNLEQKKRQQRQRDYNELLQKYNYYSGLIQDIQRKNRGRIPPLNTKEGRVRHRYIQAMQSIENLARKQGFQMPQDTARLLNQERAVTKQERREEVLEAKEEKIERNLEKDYSKLEREYQREMDLAMSNPNSRRGIRAKRKADKTAREIQTVANQIQNKSAKIEQMTGRKVSGRKEMLQKIYNDKKRLAELEKNQEESKKLNEEIEKNRKEKIELETNWKKQAFKLKDLEDKAVSSKDIRQINRMRKVIRDLDSKYRKLYNENTKDIISGIINALAYHDRALNVDIQRINEEERQEQKSKGEVLWTNSPERNGFFFASELEKNPSNEIGKVYKFTKTSQSTAKFNINSELSKYILSQWDLLLLVGCDIESKPEFATKIINKSPGEVQLSGDRWIITKKAEIKFI